LGQTLPRSSGEPLGKMSCTSEIQAAFILTPFVTFFTGLIILFIFRLIWSIFRKWQTINGTGIILELFSPGSMGHNPLRRLYSYGLVRDHIKMLLSAQTFLGKVLVSPFICPCLFSSPVGRCSSYQDKTIPVDLIFNAFFSFYFGLRFFAADDKIKFWLEMNSIVDIFTIPPTFISYYLKINWLGLRFLRALRLLELPQILQILQVIKTSNSVKFSKVMAIVLSSWFTAAGFIHLVENSGDPWLKGRNSQNISYFESIYLVVATTSTAGFGDVVAKTFLGQTFIMFFILGSLILSANYVPEMVELLANTRNYTRSYGVVKGKKYIVVCGNITVDSVTAFLRNFLHHKSGEINTDIVFLGESPPSLELEKIFKCNLAYTSFICGSALKWEDLRRVAVESAEACLIIANPLCSDSHAEDTSNILRVLCIKNYYPKTRVIIQILQSHNKVYLPKIPSWNWSTGDNIICFAELKLGFIAQGCLVPGLCTFLTSLFIEQDKKIIPKQPWEKHFLNGLKNKVLTQHLSDDFAGMSFPEVSRLCFVKMNLMLIAIEHKSKHTDESKHEFRNHIVACVFGDTHSALMGLQNFVMPLRASNYTRRELKDIVFIGSLDYMQREWRFLQNFPQIYVMPGSALYIEDLHVANIEYCSMCAILSPPSKPSHSQTLVDTETIMATLNIRSLRIGSCAHTTSERVATDLNENYGKTKYRRIPILTELKNPSNIHFIEQLGGLEGSLKETNLHLSTSFSTGTVFSGNFLDSLLATAFYNYHILELLQMLVTGGICSQLEQHLDKDKLSELPESCTTFFSGRSRCKLGLLSLDQTILSDIKPRETFGQLFCGTLDNLGILCVGLYRLIEEEERNPENKRGVCQFVITRPANEFKLLPTDLVFCAIPFSTACYKKDSSSSSAPYEITNIIPFFGAENFFLLGLVETKYSGERASPLHIQKSTNRPAVHILTNQLNSQLLSILE
uniref:Potassium channel subfamily U member 1 n=1 Tax=Oryctolagus cuniculus TaxID=9986 RepID=A0A5F9DV22_RABIT